MSRKRRTFSAALKSKIALEALREQQTMSDLAQKYQVHPSQITLWKKQAIEGLSEVFGSSRPQQESEMEEKIALLYQQIGQLQFELDWLKKKSAKL